MNKNTIKVSLIIMGLAFGSLSYAQSDQQRKQITKDYNVSELNRLSKLHIEEAYKDKEKALQLAEANGWPAAFTTEDGNYAELIGILPNGKPHYYVTMNQNAAFTSHITDLNSNGSLGLELNGQGMYVGMWDQESPRIAHNTFGGRVWIMDAALSITNHPTHVMGTMVGSGVGSPNLSAKGMAPSANGRAYNWTADVGEMEAEASTGMLVSNHSYGSFAAQLSTYMFGAYMDKTRQYDQVAFNAKNYLIVQAAGNDRGQNFNASKGGYDLINGTKTAKNAVTVAAVFGLNNEYSQPSDVVMSDFSSFGPTDDNRIKPDISAKGVNVFSSIVNGVSNSTYGNLSGTSMASPVVAGGALLLQQHYNNLNDNGTGEEPVYMKSATLRGLICHTADEAGPANGPDPMFGWGLFNAKKAAQAISGKGLTSIIEQNSLAQGQTYTKTVLAQSGQKLQVSITWTDPAGTVSNGTVDDPAPKLINDLDIRVTKDGNTYFPWKLAPNYTSAALQGDNVVDNIERIDVENATGVYTITVSHKSNITQGPQEYSLIVTGVDAAASAEDFAKKHTFTTWPNPASSTLNIALEGDFETGAYTIYDVQGREVRQGVLSSKINAVNVSGLTNGLYMIKVVSGSNQQVEKVMITN